MANRQAKNLTVVNFLATIRNHYGVKNNTELAYWLGVSKSTPTNWETRGDIPPPGKLALLRAFPGLNPEWVDSLGASGDRFMDSLTDAVKDVIGGALAPYLGSADIEAIVDKVVADIWATNPQQIKKTTRQD